MQNFVHGLTVLGNGPAIAYLIGGSLLGMFVGVIPGLGGAVVLTIILAFIYHIDVTGTLSLFLASQAGSYFSASITSILLNTPAHPEAFAVTFDGFPMAQRGEAGRALGISATSTCLGGLVGCAVLVGFIPIINNLATLFHPPEYVALVLIALLLVGTLGTDAVSKALISVGLALMISTIGSDPVTGVYRYTFNAVGLFGGISIVALFLGLFGIPQMALVFGTASTIARQDMTGRELETSAPVTLQRGFARQVIGGVRETLSHWAALLRAGLIGAVTGIIPGIGGFAANFMSYGVAQQMSRHRERFGTGIPEGIIAPEGSSLAKEAGGMVPILGLGIPGGIGGALFLAALTIKGVKVGYGFTTNYPTLAYEAVWVIALGGIIGTVAGLLSAPLLARVTRVPGPALVPFIMAVSVVGTFASDVSFFSVMEVIVFAVIGFALRRLRYSLAAFGIGLILGPTLEDNIYQTHTIFPGFTFLSARPFADVLFAIALGLVAVKWIQLRRDAKAAREATSGAEGAVEMRRLERQRHPYPLLGLVTTSLLAALGIAFVTYGATHYDFSTALMPVVGGALAGLVALWRLPAEALAYIHYRQDKKAPAPLATAEASAPAVLSPFSPPPAEPGSVVLGALVTGALGPEGDELGATPAEPLPGAMLAPATGPGAIVDKTWGRNGQYSRELLAFVWFGGLIAGCFVFGFNVGVPAFAVLYGLVSMGRVFRGWLGRGVFAIGSAVVLWALTYEIENLLHITFSPVVHL